MNQARTGPIWHALSADEALDRLETGAEGLSAAEARRRLDKHGANELPEPERRSPLSLLLRQFSNVLVVILLAAATISIFLGHAVESIAILVIVLLAVVLGFVQEYRAERSIESLRQMAAPTAKVIRDATQSEVPARLLVPGDLVLLGIGDRVPADLRLVEAVNLKVNEAPLTGESVPVAKQTAALEDEELVEADRTNLAHSGTDVVYGRGRGVVVATGVLTAFGRISGLLEPIERQPTPLQQNLDRVGRVLAMAALVVVAVIAIIGLLRGEEWLEMLLFAVALGVAVVPEALPAVVTISLALGLQRMVRRNALVRHLPTVETLGSTSVICSDKTGTLTRDEMTARRLYVGGRDIEVSGAGYRPVGELRCDGEPLTELDESLTLLLKAGVLASEAELVEEEGEWKVRGDPSEGALLVVAAKAGIERQEVREAYPREQEIPFTSDRRRMTTLHDGPDGAIAFSKGAPEVILDSCTRWRIGEEEATLDSAAREKIRATASAMARAALRVFALAYRSTDRLEEAERGMVFLGLVGMIDPPRPEAKEAIEVCRRAGIRPIMITGDHPETAEAVARELEILDRGRVVTGRELEALTDADLEREAESIDVYARVSPEHKLRVIDAWQKSGRVIAMTGDGVNDAPALKRADVGVAMGVTGTDVSREAADMTLLDDNFVSIIGAVEEGRAIFSNIKKYLMYLLSSNIGEIGLMAAATLSGLPLPLTAVQILYVNLATDGLPALALSVDPPESDLMTRPPRNPRTGVFTRPVILLMVAGGVWSALVNLLLFTGALRFGFELEHAMTLTFVSLVLIQFFKAYNFRSDRQSVLQRPFANRWLNLAVVWELALLGLIIYWPLLQQPFGTFALGARDWLVVGGLSLTVVPVLELAKWMVRRGWFGEAG